MSSLADSLAAGSHRVVEPVNAFRMKQVDLRRMRVMGQALPYVGGSTDPVGRVG